MNTSRRLRISDDHSPPQQSLSQPHKTIARLHHAGCYSDDSGVPGKLRSLLDPHRIQGDDQRSSFRISLEQRNALIPGFRHRRPQEAPEDPSHGRLQLRRNLEKVSHTAQGSLAIQKIISGSGGCCLHRLKFGLQSGQSAVRLVRLGLGAIRASLGARELTARL